MDSDAERAKAREKDILRRLKIAENAQIFIRGEILSKADAATSAESVDLALKYLAYHLDEEEATRQGSDYQNRLPTEVQVIDERISKLKQVLQDSANGRFVKLKGYLAQEVERERFLDEGLANSLHNLNDKIPHIGKRSKRPIPSYLDSRFNQVED